MKIRTNYDVPDICDYITAGKWYEATRCGNPNIWAITNDFGGETLVVLEASVHLNGGGWEIMEEDDEDKV